MKKTCILLFAVMLAPMAVGQSMTSNGSGAPNAPTFISNFPDVLVSGGNVNAWHSMIGQGMNITSNHKHTVIVTAGLQGWTYGGPKVNSWYYHPEWGTVSKVEYGNDGNIYGLIGSSQSCPGNGVGHDFARFDSPNWTVLTWCFENFQLATDGGSTVLLEDVNGTLWQGDTVTGGWQHVSGAPFPVFDAALVTSATPSTNLGYYALKTDHSIWQGYGTTVTQLPGAGLALAAANDDMADLYVIGTDNNPYHFNYTTNNWDRVASPGGMTAIAADSYATWAIGPLVNNANIYSLTENAIEWSWTYSGSVTCNVPPPYGQQICPTFHHTASDKLCNPKTGKCGAVVNATPWNNSGNWSLTSKIHTNDLWDCLINVNDPGDCAPPSPTGSMTCTGGGNNADSQQNWVVDDSIDITGYTYNFDETGPVRVPTGPNSGYYLGTVDNIVTEECAPSDPVPVCPASLPHAYIDVRTDWWGNLDDDARAYATENRYMTTNRLGFTSPYVYKSFYLARQASDGHLFNVICFPPTDSNDSPTDFLDGNIEAAPACK